MRDYIPNRETQLLVWMDKYTSVLTEHAALLGLSPEDLTALSDARTQLDEAIVAQLAQQKLANAMTTAKKAKLGAAVELVRSTTRRVVGSPNMTAEIRTELGLSVRRRRSHLPVGDEVPMLFLDSQPGRVTVHFSVAVEGKRSGRSKPAWATTCVIYRKRAGEDEYRMIGNEKASPLIDNIAGPATDYTYLARYQGRKSSDLGPESSSATIAAGGEVLESGKKEVRRRKVAVGSG